MDIAEEIKKAISLERDALDFLIKKNNEQAVDAVEVLYSCKGKVIVSGVGKAGIIARKVASTFSSTGTPAFFLHPSEAMHGDLGIVTSDDVVLILSNSGNTDEIISLLPCFKRLDIKIISVTGNVNSPLAKHSDLIIDVSVENEADPMEIAPTASTTAMLAMGDALAIALIKKRGFTREQFLIFHPGGTLGKKLLLYVKDLMHTGTLVPIVSDKLKVRDAIIEMSLKKLGVTFVVNENNVLQGIFTDGDLRRLLQEKSEPLVMPISKVMTKNPKFIKEDILAVEAIRIMELNSITVLPVVNEGNKPFAAIHLHDLISAGIA